MPHAGLMNEGAMGPVQGPLMRARLHVRGGMRRIRQGKVEAGIVTLSDALSAALDYAIETHSAVLAADHINDERSAILALRRAGVIGSEFDYEGFQRIVDEALLGRANEADMKKYLAGFETIMKELSVVPFDEARLPPEDPATY